MDAEFLRAILESPGDDLPRLVYADYLEENGGSERAEFIRVSIELMGFPENREHFGHSWDYNRPLNSDLSYRCQSACKMCRFSELQDRQRELLRGSLGCWNRWANGPQFAEFVDRGSFEEYEPGTTIFGVLCERGFVSEVRLTLAAFIGQECTRTDCFSEDGDGPEPECPRCNGTGRFGGCVRELFRNHPVTSVVLTCEPARSVAPDVWEWLTGEMPVSIGGIPSPLWSKEIASDFESRELALAALNRRAVDYGRSLAGLSPLHRDQSVSPRKMRAGT